VDSKVFPYLVALSNKNALLSTIIGVPWIGHRIALSYNMLNEKQR